MTIAKLVDNRVVAAIGCDHGKLAKYLLDNSIVDFVYISDISQPSLTKAIDLLDGYHGKFTAICCDGLSGYSDNIDIAIIAGMGGREIIKIIENSPINIDKYILSPQHNIVDVKKFLLAKGYQIVYDIVVKDSNKFYNIIKCDKHCKQTKLTQFDLVFGKDNFVDVDSDIDEFLTVEYDKFSQIKVSNQTKQRQINNYLSDIKLAQKRRKL